MIKFLLMVVFALTATTVEARRYTHEIRVPVVSVSPIYHSGYRNVTERVCYERHGRSRDRSALGAAIGAGVGTQIGDGSGRVAATIAGAAIGAHAGRPRDRITYECFYRETPINSHRILYYEVTYIYRGRHYTKQMDYPPRDGFIWIRG